MGLFTPVLVQHFRLGDQRVQQIVEGVDSESVGIYLVVGSVGVRGVKVISDVLLDVLEVHVSDVLAEFAPDKFPQSVRADAVVVSGDVSSGVA